MKSRSILILASILCFVSLSFAKGGGGHGGHGGGHSSGHCGSHGGHCAAHGAGHGSAVVPHNGNNSCDTTRTK
jgi:hypothetical protein